MKTDILGKVLDIIIAACVMFLIPLIYFGQKQDAFVQSNLYETTTNLIDNVSTRGYITKEMYNGYIKKLDTYGTVFSIDLEQKIRVLEPEYRFKTPDEIKDEWDNSWNGENNYTYIPVSTDKPIVNDNINNNDLTMNTETNESVLANAVNKGTDPNHVHTDECYIGHKHSGQDYFIHSHKHTAYCKEFTELTYLYYECGNCGDKVYRFISSYYWDDESNSIKLGSSWGGTSKCEKCDSTNLKNTKYHMGYAYSCHYDKDLDGDPLGLNDKTGTVNTYEYKKSSPQDKTVKATYTSGCYKYHNTKDPYYRTWSGVNWYYSSPGTTIYQQYTQGESAFCWIPRVYNFHYYWKYNGNTYGFSVSYYANKESDGNITYKLGTVYDYSNYSKPPATVTLEQLYRMTGKYNFLKIMNSTIDTDSDDFLDITLSDEFKICSAEDHTRTNSWYTTCGLVEDGKLNCGSKIKSIQATHPVQSVYLGEALITTATVHYFDGSSRVVVCNADFIPNTAVSQKKVSLSYIVTVDGKQLGPYTTQITVNVIPKTKVCTNSHTYKLNGDGIDPDCPYCKAWLSNLTVYAPSSKELSMYKGTTLKENGVMLLASYLDGRKEYLIDYYVNNLDKNYVGVQTVTVSYKGMNDTIKVMVRRNVKQCNVCSKYYELHPDNSDPGCPYCASLIPVFTGNVMEYYSLVTTDEIMKELYDGSGKYYFTKGDYLKIDINNRTSTNAMNMLKTLYSSEPYKILLTYGSKIRDTGQ
jgi:hypothetical protein